MRRLIVLIKCGLVMSGLLLLSVTTPSASRNTQVDSTRLDDMRLHNRQTLKTIEYEFNRHFEW